MNAIRKYLWQFITAALALVAIFATYNVFFMGRPMKALEVTIDPAVPLVDIRPEAAKDIEVLYRGESASNIFLLQVSIKNSGNQPIGQADYARPLTFSFAPTYVIADVAVTGSDPPNVGLVIGQTSDCQAEAVPTLLNPDDLVTVRFIIIGTGGESILDEFGVDARIVGIREIDIISSSEQPSSPLPSIVPQFAGGMLGIILTLLSGMLGSSGVLLRYLKRRGSRAADPSATLIILTASYGKGDNATDVTEILRSKVKDGRLELKVANDNLEGDPAYGQKKTLNVTYTYGGERHSITTDEWDTLSLP